MKRFDSLASYAKEKIDNSTLPPGLYTRAQLKKNAIDSGITLAIASVMIYVSLIQSSTRVHLQPVAVQQFVQSEVVATRDAR